MKAKIIIFGTITEENGAIAIKNFYVEGGDTEQPLKTLIGAIIARLEEAAEEQQEYIGLNLAKVEK